MKEIITMIRKCRFPVLFAATLLIVGAVQSVNNEPAAAQTQTLPCGQPPPGLNSGTYELEAGCTYTSTFVVEVADREEVIIEGNGATITPKSPGCARYCGTGMVKYGYGPLVIRDLTIAGAGNRYYPGGIHVNTGGSILLERVVIDDNRGGPAGGINVTDDTSLTLIDSTVSNNVSRGGGGGIMAVNSNYHGGDMHVELVNTTVSGNVALGEEGYDAVIPGAGGGILFVDQFDGSLTLLNSTVSGNSATVRNVSQGGGIALLGRSRAAVTIEHSTITDNEGSGLANLGYSGSVAISGTVVGNNFTNGVREDCNFGGWDGILGWDLGHNALGPGCGPYAPTSFFLSAGPRLGPLRPHGGPTRVHLPNSDSFLLDHIGVDVEGVCLTGLTTDQRGVARPQGDGCDIGAVERESVDTAPTTTTVAPTTTTVAPTTTTVAPTTTTVATPPMPLEVDESVLSNGFAVQITGTITCEVGMKFRILVDVTQGGNVANGKATGACTSDEQRFQVNGRSVAGPGFEEGSAQVAAIVEIGDPETHAVVDTFSTSEEAQMAVLGGLMGEVLSARSVMSAHG